MKLINNFMCGVQAASLAEAEYMIGAGGLDLEKAHAILTMELRAAAWCREPRPAPSPTTLLRIFRCT